MIGKLSGRLDHRGTDHVLLDVSGVGYLVYVSERTLSGLPGVGEAVSLFTDLLVREDLLQLFGFATVEEKEWHRLLMGVQGIGAKASMAILGALGPDGVARAIALGDWNAVKAAPGVGPKIAQRVVNELKGKGPSLAVSPGTPLASVIEPRDGAATAEALSALANLGYGNSEAATAVAEAQGTLGDGAGTADLIREALKRLAPKG